MYELTCFSPARFIPHTVAPNVLTLSGFVCTIQAYWIVHAHYDEFPIVVSITAAVLTSTLRAQHCSRHSAEAGEADA